MTLKFITSLGMLRAMLLCTDRSEVQTVTRVFKDLEVEVETTTNFSDAIDEIAAHKFDAILVDDEVEGSSLVLENSRKLETCQKSVRIVLADTPIIIGSAFQTGTQIVIYKPLTPERVRHGLRAVRNLMAQERRRGSKRVEVQIAAKLNYGRGQNIAVTIEDLSDSGAAVRSGSRLPGADHFIFECSLPDSSEIVRAKAEFVWRDAGGMCGIRFSDMSASSRKALLEWIKNRTSTKSQVAADSESAPLSRAAKGSQ
jgi:AmiR/NasT family two-component response regulator